MTKPSRHLQVQSLHVSADALAADPGSTRGKQIRKVKDALETAKDKVDEMEDDQH